MANKKFLFLVAPSISKDVMLNTGNKANRVEMNPPYGPLSIISYVKKHSKTDVDFEIIDLKLMAYEFLKEDKNEADLIEFLAQKIKESNPDFIAISALFSLCYNHLFWIEKAIVKSQSNAITLIGGSLGTGSYENVFKDFKRIDIVSYGEGEIPTCSLVEAQEPMKCYLSNPAIITRESLEKGIQPKSQYVQDLDEIPPYDFSYIDLEKYSGIQYLDGRKVNKSIEIITSRGCPYNCIFCSCHLMYGKKIRFHSAQRMCEQIGRYINMGYKTIRFYDENFFFDKERAKTILEFIADMKNPEILIEFPNGMMTARIDEEMAVYLKNAGLKKANLAVESGSDYVLKEIIKKPVTKEQVIRAIDSLKRHDIDITLYIVTGFPGESDEYRKETVDFVKSLNVDWAQVLVATPFKGSRLYDLCIENDYLYNYDITNISMRECHIKTPEHTPEYIEYIAYKMNLEINFIENFNMKNGRYEKALAWFVDILGKFPKHAFAHYCAAICCEKLNMPQKAETHLKEFASITNEDEFWAKYVKEFGLNKQLEGTAKK